MNLPSGKEFTFFSFYMILGFVYFFLSGLLKGKKQSPFYQSRYFLIATRLYCFSLWWVWIYWLSYPLSLVYLLYLPFYLDLSEFTGTRLSEGVRRSALGRLVQSIFGAQLVKTVDIDCQCIIGIHHHGLLPFGSVTNIGTEASGFSQLFPHLKKRVLVAASYCFMVPFFRDFVLAGSVVDCNRWSFENWLRRGYSVAVYPGGAREGLYACPEADILDLKRKRGFLRLAMKHGVPVVPAYSFNETDHYRQVTYFDLRSGKYPLPLTLFCDVFNRVTGIIIPLVTHLLPRCKSSVVTVVGAPLRLEHTHGAEPTEEQAERASQQYIREVERLYYKHAPIYNSVKSRPLVIT